jgi:hypothetical protein
MTSCEESRVKLSVSATSISWTIEENLDNLPFTSPSPVSNLLVCQEEALRVPNIPNTYTLLWKLIILSCNALGRIFCECEDHRPCLCRRPYIRYRTNLFLSVSSSLPTTRFSLITFLIWPILYLPTFLSTICHVSVLIPLKLSHLVYTPSFPILLILSNIGRWMISSLIAAVL